jgi:hypothetical protein
MLWSIAAGPLVNVVLAPVLMIAWLLARAAGWAESMHNAFNFLGSLCYLNLLLLRFNMLPIYPLDGGQILQSLLWFIVGRARALMVTVVVGFAGVGLLILLALRRREMWFGILCVFILMSCWRGLLQARALARIDKLPRRGGFACPTCQQPPIIGPLWRCAQCGQAFDTFESRGVCPHCGAQFGTTRCPECGREHAMAEWTLGGVTVAPPRM